MIPGLNANAVQNAQDDEATFKKIEAMIFSMTQRERDNPSIINGSRKRRIAAGSGTTVADINKLLKQYEMMLSMQKSMSKGKMPSFMKKMQRQRRPFGR